MINSNSLFSSNSLSANMENNIEKQPKPKKAKLGRYERIQRELWESDQDSYRLLVDVSENVSPALPFNFPFNTIDLFCGAGGLTLGLSQAGFCPVASVEVSPIASQTHLNNFPKCHHFCGDIHDFDSHKCLKAIGNPPVHLVAGGPPCQGFSVAGKRDPNDERNQLFYQFVRVVKEIQPWYVVMENVPGILTMQKGDVCQAIFEEFAQIGYPNMSVMILESAAYGVPQIRPRAIFIGNRYGLSNPYPKPQLQPTQYTPIESALAGLPEYTPIPSMNHEWTRHSSEYTERISKVPYGGSLYETFLDAFKRQYPGLPSMTVKENHGGTHIHPHLNRVISAREMARLQTFPDTFIFAGTMKKAMWQIGNAVPPRLAECIGKALIPKFNQIAQGEYHTVPINTAIRNQLSLDLVR